MTQKYQYLRKYVNPPKEDPPRIRNIFYPVHEESIKETEDVLKIVLPSELKEFYKEIGYGFLVAPENPPENYSFCNTNRINPPNVIKDILLEGQASGLISQEAFETLQPGDLPFFEIGDSSSFMIMKSNSENPNAVWFMGYEKVEDSFEKFIWNLYYDDPSYYSKRW